MMRKLFSVALLLATAGMVANSDNTSTAASQSADTNANNSVHYTIDLTIQVVKEDGSVISDSVKFTRSGMQYEIDGMTFEVIAKPDNEAGYAAIDLKIYRGTDEQGEPLLLCEGNGKLALNKEEMVQITERTNDDEVVQTMTLTFLVTE